VIALSVFQCTNFKYRKAVKNTFAQKTGFKMSMKLGQSYKRSSGFYKACLCPNFLRGLEAYFDSYKQFKCLNFLPEAQKQPQAIEH